MEPWEMTRDEWMSGHRILHKPPTPMPINTWRAQNGYCTLLDDHGFFRFPNGISNAVRKRIDRTVADRAINLTESSNRYQELLNKGEIPDVVFIVEINGTGDNKESSLAYARVVHRRCVRKAYAAGLPVRADVLADYGLCPKPQPGQIDLLLAV